MSRLSFWTVRADVIQAKTVAWKRHPWWFRRWLPTGSYIRHALSRQFATTV